MEEQNEDYKSGRNEVSYRMDPRIPMGWRDSVEMDEGIH